MKGFYEDGPLHRALPWVTASVLVLLAAILAVFQYRWLDQVAQADRHRTHAALDTAVRRFADDFNDELMRLMVAVRGGRLARRGEDLPPALVSAVETWRDGATTPDLLQAVWVFDASGARRLDEGRGALEPDSPDPRFRPLQEQVAAVLKDPRAYGRHGSRPPGHGTDDAGPPDGDRDRLRDRGRRRVDGARRQAEGGAPWRSALGPPREPAFGSELDVLSAHLPALVVPLFFTGDGPDPRTAFPDGETRGPGRRRGPRRTAPPQVSSFLVLELDRNALTSGLLPALAERHFGRSLPFHLTVQTIDGDEVVFEWDAEGVADRTGPAETARRPEAEAELFGPLMEMRGEPSRLRRILGHGEPLHEPLTRGRWLLSASHPEGSLDRALERAKRRNLAVALGILLVLGAALVLLTHSVSRARALARKQLGFVAGITHELMTPVAALRSAGQNLADGLVTEPAQISRYGRMIDSEGRRLGDLVGQVLAFARMQTERPRFRVEVLRPEALVAAARDEVESRLVAENIELVVSVADGLPSLASDRQAAVRSLVNLLGNAIKYGRPGDGPHRIVLRCVQAGSFVELGVEDHGPGISAADRRQIFEPFFRGADHAAGAVPGSGLGLALVKHWVEAQGGSVDVRSKLGHGATFIVRLPVAEENGE